MKIFNPNELDLQRAMRSFITYIWEMYILISGLSIKVIRTRESLRLDIDTIFTQVILTTKYTKSMSDSLKSELK